MSLEFTGEVRGRVKTLEVVRLWEVDEITKRVGADREGIQGLGPEALQYLEVRKMRKTQQLKLRRKRWFSEG